MFHFKQRYYLVKLHIVSIWHNQPLQKLAILGDIDKELF